MSKRKNRMRERIKEGRTSFIVKEGLYHFGIKLWLLYMLVSLIISYQFDFSVMLSTPELIRSTIYLLVFLAIGAYWGFIWFQVHTSEQKREEELKKEKTGKKKRKSN
ncbi:hypothetical protein K8O68_14665 [Salipaludibacillus sp. CUR1]|uniref:hypothetical protein n=1 Tax=Salipaludibacillus sp. CUR1 TaxID=2820003 RepID=UPI001E4C7962|nr:hypothetical protein [Salipaludibacillus sp. CUR1]MCE7793665.1 hypothetical protein [Salipaludibacillus sp. CUR1]